ncbi:hypothetical protein CPB84DRAFT_1847897 [Gymnopilus junonius]|uniref:Uncharacterized protein n=1 Tax=Gymnopilus junonius TaxID=109634 RepID=A0A9P5TLI9_GYMJU|nr:hypothetical protein CPB84DRAFT_1847897 [Gymnopilus junonius]
MSTMNFTPYPTTEMPQASVPSPPPLAIPNPPQHKMTRAQELFASAASATAAPMIPTNNIQSFYTAPNPALQSAVSPRSPYPPPSGGNRTLPGTPSGQPPNIGHASPIPQHGPYSPHRTQSSQPIRPQRDFHRAQTYAPGQGGFNVSVPQNNGPRNLITRAAPPSELSNLNIPTLALQTNGSGSPNLSMSARPSLSPASLSGQSSGTTPSPPASSILFSSPPSSVGTPMSSPPTSPPTFMTSPSISPQVAPRHTTSSAMIPPPPRSTTMNNNTNNAGLVAVGAMFKLANGIFSATTGSSSGILSTVGNFVTNPTIFGTLTSALTKKNTGVSDADLQAVMQARPGANYQGVINTLMQQQLTYQQQSAAYMQAHPGMAPPRPSVDYQALITEVQRLQQVSQHQQQAQTHPQLQQHQLQQLAHQQQANQWAQQQQQVQHFVPQPQQQSSYFAPQQQQAQPFTPQQQSQTQQVYNHSQQPQHLAQQQATQMTQQQNPVIHQHQHQASPQQQQQNDQNHYAQAFHTMQHLYHEMTEQPQQPPHQQQQEEQPQQQQPQQPSEMDTNNNSSYSFDGDSGSGQQQQQQSPMTDIFGNLNSTLGGGNVSGQTPPPPFDALSLYTGDPNGEYGSGGGDGLISALNQTFGNSDGGQTDGSGMVALLTGVNQALNPLDNFGQGVLILGSGTTIIVGNSAEGVGE